MIVYAFDRDDTVNSSDGPIQLESVRNLSEKEIVYASGNQKLCFEADVLGFGAEEGTKPERLMKIKELHSDVDSYVVVDDEDLSDVEGWNHYFPDQFMKKRGLDE